MRSIAEVMAGTGAPRRQAGNKYRRSSVFVLDELAIGRPLDRNDRARILFCAEALERRTKEPGKRNGALGYVGLAILRALLLRFLGRNGLCCPCYLTLQACTGLCRASIAEGLRRLEDADAGVEGIVMPPTGLMGQSRTLIARLALMRRLPLMVGTRVYMELGALMSYGPDTPAIFRRAAVYVDKILKGEKPAAGARPTLLVKDRNGRLAANEKPADLPVEQTMKNYELVVNLKTAKELGITFPPSIMVQAEEVIE
jgi:hypothetical protein